MELYEEFTAIARAMSVRNVRYAVVGAIAMAYHDQPRYTRDSDQDRVDIKRLNDDEV